MAKKPINWEVVKLMVENMCTQQEIADRVGCSVDTLQRREQFMEIWREGRAVRCETIRKAQLDRALGGSDQMLKWLGKQYLGQKEKIEVDTNEVGPPGKIEFHVRPAKGEVTITNAGTK